MIIIELRRHSNRVSPSPHLNQEGVEKARKVGNELGDFDKVISSNAPRAIETAVAMGYAVDMQSQFLDTFGQRIQDKHGWPMTFQEISTLLEISEILRKFAEEQFNFYMSLLERIETGQSILIVSHGGVMDIPFVYSLKMIGIEPKGEDFSYCEGFRFHFNDFELAR